MKIITLLSSILFMFLLQGCTGLVPMYPAADQELPKQSLSTPVEVVPIVVVKPTTNPVPAQIASEDMPNSLNEARIIKELNNAGCTISSFEMNKNKQNIRIICADSIQKSDFSI